MDTDYSDRIAIDEEIMIRRDDVRREWRHIYPEDATAEMERREQEKRAEWLDGTKILF